MGLKRKATRAVQKFGSVTVNKVVLAILRSGLPFPAVNGKSMVAVSTVGRRSGTPRVTPMGYLNIDDRRVWVVSEHGVRSDWYRNARAGGIVEVLVAGRSRRATVQLLSEEDPSAVLRRIPSRLVAAANRSLWSEPRVVELRFID